MFGFEYLVGLLEVLANIGYSIVWAIPINFVWSKLGIVYFVI